MSIHIANLKDARDVVLSRFLALSENDRQLLLAADEEISWICITTKVPSGEHGYALFLHRQLNLKQAVRGDAPLVRGDDPRETTCGPIIRKLVTRLFKERADKIGETVAIAFCGRSGEALAAFSVVTGPGYYETGIALSYAVRKARDLFADFYPEDMKV